MALIAEREVSKRDRDRFERRDGDVHASAHAIAIQRKTAMPATIARRASTLAPRTEIAECR
jgi:hypothetical protein